MGYFRWKSTGQSQIVRHWGELSSRVSCVLVRKNTKLRKAGRPSRIWLLDENLPSDLIVCWTCSQHGQQRKLQLDLFFFPKRFPSDSGDEFLVPDWYPRWILALMHMVLGMKNQAKGFFRHLFQEVLVLAGSWGGTKCRRVWLSDNDFSPLISVLQIPKSWKNTKKANQTALKL